LNRLSDPRFSSTSHWNCDRYDPNIDPATVNLL
jgi:hypothetical protein